MLEPSLPFYAALFGAMKRGAVAVPLFTLFGPDGVRAAHQGLRAVPAVDHAGKGDASLRLSRPRAYWRRITPFMAALGGVSGPLRTANRAGRHGDLPVHVRHDARDAGGDQAHPPCNRRGDERGALWHRHAARRPVLLPVLACLGPRPVARHAGAAGAGRRDRRLRRQVRRRAAAAGAAGLSDDQFVGRRDPLPDDEEHRRTVGDYRIAPAKAFLHRRADRQRRSIHRGRPWRPLCSMYGTTEIGVVLANYPGAPDFRVKPGSLGRPVPGVESRCRRPDGHSRAQPGELGEIKVRRHGAWFPTKDLGRIDEDGYFYHAGRADDVIISAGWTMSAVEIEDALLGHPDVREAAVIGVPDALRGQVVKAFVVPAPATHRRQPCQRDAGFHARAAQPARISRAWSPSSPNCRGRRPARSTAGAARRRKPPRHARPYGAKHERRNHAALSQDHR